jgi:hypothetical protein
LALGTAPTTAKRIASEVRRTGFIVEGGFGVFFVNKQVVMEE